MKENKLMPFELLVFDWEGTLVHETSLREGVVEWLRRLKEAGYELAVATGNSRQSLDSALEKFELKSYFSITRTADETFSKPHPLMLNEILDVLGVEKHRALMIGDTVYDLQMAENAGCASVAMSYGMHNKAQFKHYHPLAIFDSFHALGEWLM